MTAPMAMMLTWLLPNGYDVDMTAPQWLWCWHDCYLSDSPSTHYFVHPALLLTLSIMMKIKRIGPVFKSCIGLGGQFKMDYDLEIKELRTGPFFRPCIGGRRSLGPQWIIVCLFAISVKTFKPFLAFKIQDFIEIWPIYGIIMILKLRTGPFSGPVSS